MRLVLRCDSRRLGIAKGAPGLAETPDHPRLNFHRCKIRPEAKGFTLRRMSTQRESPGSLTENFVFRLPKRIFASIKDQDCDEGNQHQAADRIHSIGINRDDGW